MKSQRRHELQQNELAQWLEKKIERIKPYWQGIVGGVVAVIVIGLAWLLISGQMSKARSASWNDYFAAFGSTSVETIVGQLTAVGETHSGTAVGLWARQSAADLLLDSGSRQLYSNPAEAQRELNRAITHYEFVARNASEPLLQQRALFGLGQALEGTFDLPKARERYEEIVRRWPDSAIGKEAATRLEMLGRSEIKEFYAWYQKQDFEAAQAARTTTLEGLDRLPDRPDLRLPDDINLGPPREGDAGPLFPPLDAPAAPSTRPEEPGHSFVPADPTPGDVSDMDPSDLEPATPDADAPAEPDAPVEPETPDADETPSPVESPETGQTPETSSDPSGEAEAPPTDADEAAEPGVAPEQPAGDEDVDDLMDLPETDAPPADAADSGEGDAAGENGASDAPEAANEADAADEAPGQP